MRVKEWKYIIRSLRLFIKNASNNYDTINSHKSVFIDPKFVVNNCRLEGYNYFFDFGWVNKCSLGAFTYVQYGACLGNTNIGRFCSIGPGVITAHGEHPKSFMSTHPIFFEPSFINGVESFVDKPVYDTHKDVNIGSDVWVGANCYIKDGVSIGHGAIIGAGSVVTKDIPPYAIAVGVPAKVIKYRFDEQTISRLLDMKWWEWDIEKLYDLKEHFQVPLNRETIDMILSNKK